MSVQSSPASAPAAPGLLVRLLEENNGPREAWYGANLPASLAGVDAALAYTRPAPGRHHIAEIALHHAYWLHEVRHRLSGRSEPFAREGKDWFSLAQGSEADWAAVRQEVETQAAKLAATVTAIAEGRQSSPLDESARLDLVVGIAGHAAYHAGQVQLVKALVGG